MSKPVFSDLFALQGRRNRKSYFLYALCIAVILIVVWGIAVAITSSAQSSVPMIVAYIISVILGISVWIVGAQRCRDFGWTGWAILLTLIPFVGAIFAIAILFVPGTQGPNRFGSDPLAAA
jgi:uncharacterized membrane protein YhaH (DUF805 family)